MSAKPFKQDSGSRTREPVVNSFVSEALAKQAAMRPKKTPPRELTVTPKLPRIAKKPRNRRKI